MQICLGTGKQIQEAEQVRDELALALRAAQIRLPSLAVEAAAYAQEHPRPLMELGRCDVQTARVLAAVVRAGAPYISRGGGAVAPGNSG